jgi:hypothetical protein
MALAYTKMKGLEFMNMVKLNNKLTGQVIAFTDIMQSYQGIEQNDSFYTMHKENGVEVLDIDFRLKINDSGLIVSINKSYDKDTIAGGHYMEDTQIEVDINALETWLEDNRIYSKQAHTIANRLFNTVSCIALWESMEGDFSAHLYKEYEKCSAETETAVKILLEQLPNLQDRYYVQKVWTEIKMNEEMINKLF